MGSIPRGCCAPTLPAWRTATRCLPLRPWGSLRGRREAAKLLEAKQVPVVVAGGLAPDKVKALRLADNRTNRDSDGDIRLLAQGVEELRGGNSKSYSQPIS